MGRPPLTPYAVADSLEVHPWLPSDEPRVRTIRKWRTTQRGFGRFTGSHDLAIGQYALYQTRYIRACDLTGDWGEFGGLVAQFGLLANVLGLSITDRAGLSATYDRRIRQAIQKTSMERSAIRITSIY